MKDYLDKQTALEQEYDEKYRQFDYDAEQDAIFRLQRKQLEREREDGVSDLIARYAANTGMAGSSAAMSAARDTSARYVGQITDALTNAEQTAYARWSADRAALEAKMADNHRRAIEEADRRLALGDTSGYRELGYDTSAYEAKLERERRAEEARIAAALNSGSSGNKTNSKNTPVRGGNGMTEAEYKAERENILEQIRTYENDWDLPQGKEKVAGLYRQLDRLDEAYYSTPRHYTDSEIGELLYVIEANAGIGEKTILSYPEYLALADYFKDEGGEEYLARNGITFARGY